METSYNSKDFNFSQYLREHPFETWGIPQTFTFPKFIERVLSPRLFYNRLYFQNFRVFHPENCIDFLVDVLLQFPEGWDILEVHYIEEDTTDKPLKRGYPDLYTIYRVDTGSTDPVNLDFLKNLHEEEVTIFSYYDYEDFLNIVTIQKA